MFHETVLRLELPEKYCFDIDANGLRIVRQSDNADLHITADDFIRMTKGAYNWQAQLEQNLQRRLANAEADARNQAESAKAEASRKMMEDIRAGKRSVLSGVYVTIQDSVSGGNCIAGTNAFIERCGLKKRSIVSASALTRICKAKAPESLDRLALAIAAAKKRIEQRMSGLAPCPLTQIHARTA
jgi:hypothetical protein